MSNGKLLTGSLCLTDILEHAKKVHSAFSKAKNGKIYFNFKQWINEEEDRFGNHSQILLNPKKDAETDKAYIGNAKMYKQEEPKTLTKEEISKDLVNEDDLLF